MANGLDINRKKPRSRTSRVVVIVLACVGLVLLAGGAWLFIESNKSTEPSAPKAKTAPVAPKVISLESRVLFTGNVFWGRYIDDWSNTSGQGTAYPFSRLGEFNREAYDAWIAGLECPTVPGLKLTSAQQEEALSFNCSPDYLPEAAKWFTAFTLANNHTDNQGVDGFAATKTELDKNSIQHFGHYDPEALDEICNVVQLPVRLKYDDDETKKAKVPLVFCGHHGVFKIPSADSIAKITEYSEYMPVISMPHMGAEYKPAPDEIKTSVYRKMIDAGAEMVIGDHPHWVQSTEAYNGKLIVYSMGNFMFDQQGSTELIRSAAIDLTINSDGSNVEKWIKVGESCGNDLAKCVELAKAQKLAKIKLSYKFDVVGSDDSGKITHKATDEQLVSIKQRLNWDATMQKLVE